MTVTDVAVDVKRQIVYLGTCCEPGSGQLRRVDLGASTPGFDSDDQGFAVDVGGDTSTIARTDTFGTLAIRPSSVGKQEVRAGSGASDVAVDPSAGVRIIALLQPQRLRAVVPTAPSRKAGLLDLRWTDGRWTDTTHPLAEDTLYCRVVALSEGRVGLLAGQLDPTDPRTCTGTRLDVYDPAARKLHAGALTFPAKVRHLGVDDSSTFLIFTTVDGAVRWRTLAGESGELARRGFVAADW